MQHIAKGEYMHKLQGLLLKSVLLPAGRRLGTLAAGYMVALGLPAQETNTFLVATSAICLIAFDLVVSKIHEKNIEGKK